ncbi:Hypothetical protein AA314_01626 [Archangium gephyra]|uniref:Uncharacterized protein n=1 Tax=Archangium gephyra TaxID=48 RepID=A0AAC8TBM8_9BACT|nr:Hypothetical protein AA314_01626 [Archangium gephyra]
MRAHFIASIQTGEYPGPKQGVRQGGVRRGRVLREEGFDMSKAFFDTSKRARRLSGPSGPRRRPPR